MYAIITNVKIDKFGFFSKYMIRTINISILDNKVVLNASSQKIHLCFKCSERFFIIVSVKEKELQEEVNFDEKCKEVSFSFENVNVKMDVILVEDVWAYFDSSIKIDSFESPECGRYFRQIKNDKITTDDSYDDINNIKMKYFVNLDTLETSFNPTFSLEKEFPAFHKAIHNGITVYVDSINKLVIKTNPKIRKASVLNRASHFIREYIDYSPFLFAKKVLIDRQNLIESAYRKFLLSLKDRSLFNISISFKNELGEDQGALRREFLYLLFNSLISDDRIDKNTQIYDVDPSHECPEFIYFNSDRVDQINTLEDIMKDDIFDSRGYFILLGATLACLFLLSETIQVNFSLVFFENLLNRRYTLRHIQDEELQKNLSEFYMKGDDDYMKGDEEMGTMEDFINERIIQPRQNQYDHIKFGFDFILDSKNIYDPLFNKEKELSSVTSRTVSSIFSQKFSSFDFPFIFYHFEKITVEKLKRMTTYVRCNEDTQEIRWFWEELENKDQYFLSKLILFTTGSGSLQNDNVGSLLTLERVAECNRLFRASACINRLYIPRFTEREALSKYLEMSIMDSEGFHFV